MTMLDVAVFSGSLRRSVDSEVSLSGESEEEEASGEAGVPAVAGAGLAADWAGATATVFDCSLSARVGASVLAACCA